MRALVTWLWTAWFVTYFFASSAVLFFGGVLIFLATRLFDRNGRLLHLYTCFWGFQNFWVSPGWKMQVVGREKLPWRGAAVIVANHASYLDSPAILGLFRPFKIVSRASVFKVPFIGWNMSLNGYVPIKRGQSKSANEMMDACRAWLRRGVPVFLFCEGTRSSDGEIQPFKSGAFRLAVETGSPVYPVVIDGTFPIMAKGKPQISFFANARMEVLDPIPPGDDVDRLRDEVRRRMVEKLAEIRGNPVPGSAPGGRVALG